MRVFSVIFLSSCFLFYFILHICLFSVISPISGVIKNMNFDLLSQPLARMFVTWFFCFLQSCFRCSLKWRTISIQFHLYLYCRPVLNVAFLSHRMQLKQKIMR